MDLFFYLRRNSFKTMGCLIDKILLAVNYTKKANEVVNKCVYAD